MLECRVDHGAGDAAPAVLPKHEQVVKPGMAHGVGDDADEGDQGGGRTEEVDRERQGRPYRPGYAFVVDPATPVRVVGQERMHDCDVDTVRVVSDLVRTNLSQGRSCGQQVGDVVLGRHE